MERFALVLSCDVMKGTVTGAAVYGHDSSRLLMIRPPPVFTLSEVCVCVGVCENVYVYETEGNPANLSHPVII